MDNQWLERKKYYYEKQFYYKKQRKLKCMGECPILHGAANAQGLPRAGNTNMPGWTSTYVYRMSHAILLGKGKSRRIPQKINAFGSKEGSPHGCGKPPSN